MLTPSANERAKKYGKTPAYYRDSFTIHTDCLLEIRRKK